MKETAVQEITARYIAFWRARFAANRNIPNPDDPSLDRFAVGAQLDAVVAETRSNLARGLAFRRSDHPANLQRVTVVSLNASRAVVQECVVSDDVVVRQDTGVIDDDDVVTHNVRGELVRVDGEWKVSSTRLVQRWEGVAGCALASS